MLLDIEEPQLIEESLSPFFKQLKLKTKPLLKEHTRDKKFTLSALQKFLRNLNLVPVPFTIKDSEALFRLVQDPHKDVWLAIQKLIRERGISNGDIAIRID